MGLFIQQNDSRTELQQRIDAELRAKAQAAREDAPVDPVNADHYLAGTKTTTSLAAVWLVIFLLAVATAVLFFVKTS
jgi:CHASE3 domain sensor protein